MKDKKIEKEKDKPKPKKDQVSKTSGDDNKREQDPPEIDPGG